MGNICRSPVARYVFEGVARREGLEVEADSAGTHGFYHAGEGADPRASESALRRGVDLSGHRARLLEREDLGRFDYVLAMDRENLRRIEALRGGSSAKVALFMDYAPEHPEREVPDPYYGGPEGFERVLDLVEAASEGLVAEIKERRLAARSA